MTRWERSKDELKHRAHIPEDETGRRSLITALTMMGISVVTFALAWIGGSGSPPILGALFLASGIAELIDANKARHTPHGLRIGLAGALPCLLGVFLIFQLGIEPRMNAVAIALFFAASALFRGGAAVFDFYPRWQWDVAYSAVTLVLAFVLFSRASSDLMLQFAALLMGVEFAARAISIAGRDFAYRRRELIAQDPRAPPR